MSNSDVMPYLKYLGKEIKDPEIRASVEKLPGDPKINKAKFLMALDWFLNSFKKEIENNKIKESKNE